MDHIDHDSKHSKQLFLSADQFISTTIAYPGHSRCWSSGSTSVVYHTVSNYVEVSVFPMILKHLQMYPIPSKKKSGFYERYRSWERHARGHNKPTGPRVRGPSSAVPKFQKVQKRGNFDTRRI